MNHARFAVLITGDPTETTRDIYGTYGDLFVTLLKRQGEIWDIFDTRALEYPENCQEYTAFLITGSASTAHESLPWIEELKEFIVKLHRDQARILGICFGHQALAGALGGVTGVNENGWEIGLHRLDWCPSVHEIEFTKSLPLPETVLEIHRDHVVRLPPSAKVLAATSQTPVQVFCLGENILGVQGHPEFFNDIVEDLVIRRSKAGIIGDAAVEKALVSLENEPARGAWVQWLRAFLDKV